ncbi:hypothetical protein SLS62_004494 [Diatrype stigma]|uniref:Uncharacterized protein n=1 Tax=Diatrype stigma TaxID=117547 RepID=A0AAN9YQK4_9PEZI
MPAKKRTKATATPAPEAGPRRRSQRVSSTGKKSSYFAVAEDSGADDSDEPPRKRQAASAKIASRRKSKNVEEESDDFYHIDDDDDDPDDAEVGNGDDDDDDDGQDGSSRGAEAHVPKKRGRPPKQQQQAKPKVSKQASKAANAKKAKKQPDSDRDADDDESDDDDEEESRVTFIPLPPLRDTDGVEYEDTRLHKNTLLFLRDLKANNKRSWLKMRDPEYRRSLKDWESFVETLTERITEADETIPELPLKDVIFRIYRDIRFSKDPTPYKPHYSAAWSRTGRKGPYACYYVHAEPGSCFVGGGLWHPDGEALARLRASIDERPHRLRRVLARPAFRRTFLPAAAADEASVLAAFAAANQENALKTKPKGFHPDHRDIELLKLRNYTVGKKIDDSVLTSEDAQDQIMEIISSMVEFEWKYLPGWAEQVTFLNSVVRPDPNLDSDSDGGEDGEEEGEEEEGESTEEG